MMKTCKLDKKMGYIDIKYKNIFNEYNTYSIELIRKKSYRQIFKNVKHLLGKTWCTAEIIDDYTDLQFTELNINLYE